MRNTVKMATYYKELISCNVEKNRIENNAIATTKDVYGRILWNQQYADLTVTSVR